MDVENEEDAAAFSALMIDLTDGIREKALNIGKLVLSLEADAEAIKIEEKRLQARRLSRERKAQWLRDYLEGAMKTVGVPKVYDTVITVQLQKNPSSVDVVDVKAIPPKYWTPQEPTLDRRALLPDLKVGEVPGAKLQQKESLRIK